MLQARNKQANRACTTSNNKWMDVKHCARHLMAFKLDFINVTWSFGWLSSIDYRQLWIFVASSVFLATKTVGWCHQLAPYASTLSSILNRKSTGVIDLSFLLLFLLSSLTLSFFASLIPTHSIWKCIKCAQITFTQFPRNTWNFLIFNLHRVWDFFLFVSSFSFSMSSCGWIETRSERKKNVQNCFRFSCADDRSKPIQLIKCVKSFSDWIIACLY